LSIFISIAAYRDPELLPTILDCVAKADHPEDLRFGICQQHGSDELPLVLPARINAKLIRVGWRESRGVCWARAEIMRLWAGDDVNKGGVSQEDYYLQLDSHHRFAAQWDTKLIGEFHSAGSPRPILSTYAPAYTPGQEALRAHLPTKMDLDGFTENSIAVFRPSYINGWEGMRRPLRARFVSAHFLFAPACFLMDVPYDAELYFIGEEITLAVRAFTQGYDLFHPREVIVWHEYTRDQRPKHWDDHVEPQGVELEWHKRDEISIERVRRLLTTGEDGRFGCGKVRSLRDYEQYAGIDFQQRLAQEQTWRGEEPPNTGQGGEWLPARHCWRVKAVVRRENLSALATQDAEFWYVGMHDAQGREIYREDAGRDELASVTRTDSAQIEIERVFESSLVPATWTVWPFSASSGWLSKIDGVI